MRGAKKETLPPISLRNLRGRIRETTMLSNQFWDIISAISDESGATPEKLVSHLKSLPDDAVVSFRKEFYQGLMNLNRWDIWGAGYVMAGGMGDDSFHYFRSWIIGKGKSAYETALRSPDDLGPFASEDDEFESELLEYAVLDVLEERELEDPADEFEGSPDDAPEGEAWDEDNVYDLYPKLSEQFN